MNVDFDKLFSIDGKCALVTGGSRGIGEMIAAGFLANGARVYISSRKAEACAETVARLTSQYGGECHSIPADLSTLEGVTTLADALGKREDKLDSLVNNQKAILSLALAEGSLLDQYGVDVAEEAVIQEAGFQKNKSARKEEP